MLAEGFKKGFDAWESATARLLEVWLKSPLVLEPGGALLSALFKAKAASDDLAFAFWGRLGLPTRRKQEEILHELHRLQSRLLDLEERLEANGKDEERGG